MNRHTNSSSNFWGLGEVLSHIVMTLAAIAIAFSLPSIAQFILYQWWPEVRADAHMLLATEIGFAALLALLFTAAKNSLKEREVASSAKLASLVYASSNANWLSRWRERVLLRKLPATRDAFIMTMTGFDTFARKDSHFRPVLESAYEIRVMLLNPASDGARKRADSLSNAMDAAMLWNEMQESIAYLRALRKFGKKVTLKFYDHPPFWKLVILGEYVWVQYCHGGCEVTDIPEYVFALHSENPKRGLFVPFYMLFLEKWNEPVHPEFDFDTKELVYRDAGGSEIRRVPFVEPQSAWGMETDMPAVEAVSIV